MTGPFLKLLDNKFYPHEEAPSKSIETIGSRSESEFSVIIISYHCDRRALDALYVSISPSQSYSYRGSRLHRPLWSSLIFLPLDRPISESQPSSSRHDTRSVFSIAIILFGRIREEKVSSTNRIHPSIIPIWNAGERSLEIVTYPSACLP
jgi:hypothetical protein